LDARRGVAVTTVSGLSVVDEAGFPVLADPHGNNVAFRCLGCGAPVLAVVLEHQRGCSAQKPSVCPACGAKFWVEAVVTEQQLVVHRVS
jgi:DNA-directed RNA polymerase subunit RPC12/RpoP